jgi:hypothetical protein
MRMSTIVCVGVITVMSVIILDFDGLQLEKLAARHADDSLALVDLVPEQLVRVVARAAGAANDARRKGRRHFHRIRLGAKRTGEQALVRRKDWLAGADRVQFTFLQALNLIFDVWQFHIVRRFSCTTRCRRCN